MTSTNINIGFRDESKYCVRTLKPPGGGHSDIFGIKEGNETQIPNKRRNHPPTTIDSCFVYEDTTKSNNKVENRNENGTKTADVTDENVEPKQVSEAKDEKKETEQNATIMAPHRVAAQRAGYSSGFW